MAANFIGLTVEVTLKQGGVIQGRVNAIDQATSSLQLHDGTACFYLENKDLANSMD